MKDFVLLHEELAQFSAWTVVETYTALICANLPSMTTLIRRTFNKITSSVGLSTSSSSGPVTAGEKRRGSSSGSGNSSNHKVKDYFQSLRHKRSGSEAQLARKAAPFGFNQTHAPSPTTDSPSIGSPTVAPAATAMGGSLSSPTQVRAPTVTHQSKGRFHYLPFYHQSRKTPDDKAGPAPQANGIEIETDVDIEKADIAEVAGTGDATAIGTTIYDDDTKTGGGRASGSKDFGTRSAANNHPLSNSAMTATSRPWGTITTVTGRGSSNNASNNKNKGSSAKASADAHDYTNASMIGNAITNVGHGHELECEHVGEPTRLRTRPVLESATDNMPTKTTSTHSYQVGLPIQRLGSEEI